MIELNYRNGLFVKTCENFHSMLFADSYTNYSATETYILTNTKSANMQFHKIFQEVPAAPRDCVALGLELACLKRVR
jgi:hypothetical protein